MSNASGPWDEDWVALSNDDQSPYDTAWQKRIVSNGAWIVECNDEHAALIAAAPAMARLLCRLEWSSVQDETGCVVCGEFADGDVPEHTADCLLDAALTAAGLDAEERERVRQK